MSNYYNKTYLVRLSERQQQMLSILSDILNEDRSKMLRRLLIAEGKRASAFLSGEELDLWLSLLEEIEDEEEMQSYIRGEAISEGRARAYKEKHGVEPTYIDRRTIDKRASDAYASAKKWRAKRKLVELNKRGWFNEKVIQRKGSDGTVENE